MRQFDLKPPFPRCRALSENLQNDRCAVQHLAVPGLLEVALLHRRQVRIDNDDVGFLIPGDDGDLFNLAGAQQGRGRGPRQRRDLRHHHIQMNGGGQPDGFVQPRLSIPQGARGCRAALGLYMDDKSLGAQTQPSAGSS